MHRLLELSGVQLARLIRRREVSSTEVVGAHIRYAQAVNPSINAIVRDRFGEALEEAREADALLARSPDAPIGPFFGVPCTIKESFALTGMPNSAGLVTRRGLIAETDATAVARLRAAGCIPMGVTNVSELCMWMETHNRVYGRTNNPYDTRRIVGGSSGGEGAIVGAGASPFGLGADIGGSIRMPAFFNSVFGHKPSGGLVPGTGQFPMAENAALRYLTTGPIARRAEDLYPLVAVLAGPDGRDTGCEAMPLGDPHQVRVDELRYFVIDGNGRVPVHAELQRAQRSAAEHLRRLGARVVDLRIERLRHSFEIWSAMLEEASDTPYKVLLGSGRPIGAALELGRWAVLRSPHTLPSILLALTEHLPAMMPGHAAKMLAHGHALKAELDALLGDDGVLLYPPYARPAPRHLMPMLGPLEWTYTAILNVMELPATQVPLGLNAKGVPLGVQVVGGHGQDHLTMAVALELERAFGGWIPPRTHPRYNRPRSAP